jgi:hypothetical protein
MKVKSNRDREKEDQNKNESSKGAGTKITEISQKIAAQATQTVVTEQEDA